MNTDLYKTVEAVGQAKLVEKRSVFLGFAVPVTSSEDAEERLREYRKKYYDARHVCYAYRTGADGGQFMHSDAGEPSGTAGRPIYDVIQSEGLTYLLVVVVRYFGGIKLGTPGLRKMYKEAAQAAIAATRIVEREELGECVLCFDYASLNRVMQAVKFGGYQVRERQLDSQCRITVVGGVGALQSLQEQLSDCLVRQD